MSSDNERLGSGKRAFTGGQMASVDIRSVTKRFGSVQVLHGVDVGIDDGEFVVLVGPVRLRQVDACCG